MFDSADNAQAVANIVKQNRKINVRVFYIVGETIREVCNAFNSSAYRFVGYRIAFDFWQTKSAYKFFTLSHFTFFNFHHTNNIAEQNKKVKKKMQLFYCTKLPTPFLRKN